MKPEGDLVFLGAGSPLVVVFCLALVLATGFFCVWAWRRTGYAKGTGWLELIRFLIVILVAITLLQPEWRREMHRPNVKPTLTVLWDKSTSMQTRDIIDPAKPAAQPARRSEYIAPFLDEKEWWTLGDRMRVVIEPFASTLEPSEGGTDIHAALDRVLKQEPNLGAIVLFSDGDWNTGSPPAWAANSLRTRDVPVFAVPVGSETRLPDLELSRVDAPTFGVAGKPLRIPFTIESSLPRDHTADVELTTDTGESETKTVVIPAMTQVQDTITWTPKKTGEVNLKVKVTPAPNELIADNNEVGTPIAIREEQLRVLLIETYPRWEYRYLRNALERDPGVEVSCLLFHPDLPNVGGGRNYIKTFPNDEELVKYDVVFLGDVGVGTGQLNEEQCKRLVQLVRNHASGLVFLPGFRGYQFSLLQTGLSDLYPVVLDEMQPRGWGSPTPGQFELTELGARSLLTRLEDTDDANSRLWESLPGFQWFAPALRSKAGSEVLAAHSSESTEFGRVPLIVTKTYGAGKILFMGTDGAWRWREGVEDKYHYRFWGQVTRWMAYQRNMAQGDLMRLFYSPDRPRNDEVLTLNANVMSLGGEPLREATVVVQLVSPSGKTESVRLASAGEESWGLFTGRFTPTEPGQYKAIMTCRENGATLETTISVQGGAKERIGRPARFDVLDEIARVTKGQVLEPKNLQDVLAAIRALPEPKPDIRSLRIWSHWAWGALLVTLLAAFWVGRKMVGMI